MTLVRAATCLSLLLFGCATPREPKPIPYTLTDAEIEAVENGIRATRHDLSNPAFNGFRATRHEGGQIDVCGWVSAHRGSLEHPFIGTLFAGQFAPERFGGDEGKDAEILYECKTRRAAI